MRPPLGIPREEHRRYALALMELDFLLDHSGAGRASKLCNELRSELDEHIFAEFTELPKQSRFDTYYTADWIGFKPEECSLDHALGILPELVERLDAVLPDSPVHKAALDFQKELGKSAVQQKLLASQERHERAEKALSARRGL